jgi:hypothetical protein
MFSHFAAVVFGVVAGTAPAFRRQGEISDDALPSDIHRSTSGDDLRHASEAAGRTPGLDDGTLTQMSNDPCDCVSIPRFDLEPIRLQAIEPMQFPAELDRICKDAGSNGSTFTLPLSSLAFVLSLIANLARREVTKKPQPGGQSRNGEASGRQRHDGRNDGFRVGLAPSGRAAATSPEIASRPA